MYYGGNKLYSVSVPAFVTEQNVMCRYDTLVSPVNVWFVSVKEEEYILVWKFVYISIPSNGNVELCGKVEKLNRVEYSNSYLLFIIWQFVEHVIEIQLALLL